MQITDLHNHLVPGVDDGSASVEESLEILSGLRREGVAALVTTPHLLLPRLETEAAVVRELDTHRCAFDRLMDGAAERDDLPALALGQEVWAPTAALAERALRQPGIGLAGTRFLLVEFGFHLQGTHADVVQAVLDAGRQIIIAHPERYCYRAEDDPLETMRQWQEMGALLQVNAGSVSGYYTGAAKILAWQMVGEGLADLVATDHHGIRREGVSPRQAFDTLVAHGERDLAEKAMMENPRRVVRNEIPKAGRAAGRGTPGGARELEVSLDLLA